jgi:hypothetical protein
MRCSFGLRTHVKSAIRFIFPTLSSVSGAQQRGEEGEYAGEGNRYRTASSGVCFPYRVAPASAAKSRGGLFAGRYFDRGKGGVCNLTNIAQFMSRGWGGRNVQRCPISHSIAKMRFQSFFILITD